MRLLVALAAATVVFTACGHTGSPVSSRSASPSGSASPTPVSTPLNVTNSTPVIFFRDPANFDQIDGMTWDGAVGMAPGVPDYHTANPSGTLFGETTAIRDRKKVVIAYGSFGAKSFAATWADDGIHYALMEPFAFLGAAGVPATVKVGSVVGFGTRAVAQVGKVYEQGAVYVVAYGFAADRLVVVQEGGQGIGVAEYWVVQVSSGKVLWTHRFASSPAPTSIVSSHDVRLIAENYDPAEGVQTSTVYDSFGVMVRRYDSAVAAFSWDGARVVLTSRSAQVPATVSTIDGRILWSPPAKRGLSIWSAMAEPNGARIAVAVLDAETSFASSTWKGLPIVDLYVIGSEGDVVKSLKGVYW